MASNPTLSQIKVGNVVYDICDASTRNSIVQIQNSISQLNKIYNSEISLTNINATGTVKLFRINSIVCASYGANTKVSTADTVYTCGTIPSGYIPAYSIAVSGIGVSNNSFSAYYRWRFLYSGSVTFQNSVAAIRETHFSTAWYTENTFPSN